MSSLFQTLHQLTARAIIRDWTDGSLDSNRMEHEVSVCGEGGREGGEGRGGEGGREGGRGGRRGGEGRRGEGWIEGGA